MTQAALAQQAGVGRQWIAGLESGRMTNPQWQGLLAVLEVLGLEAIVRLKTEQTLAPDPSLSAVLDRLRVDTAHIEPRDG